MKTRAYEIEEFPAASDKTVICDNCSGNGGFVTIAGTPLPCLNCHSWGRLKVVSE